MDTKNQQQMPYDFIQIKSHGIEYGWRTYCKQDGDMWIGVIPAFDICFSVPSRDKVNEMSRAMVKSFIEYWAT